MDTLGIATWLSKLCRRFRLVEPTKIQRQTIPTILKGHDVLASAPTGSGKTACYMLPIIQDFAADAKMFFAIIILPTRELAAQVVDQFSLFGTAAGMRAALITGGADLVAQKVQLMAGVHIVIGTPGRLQEMVQDVTLKKAFSRFKYIVLDECDRLLQRSMSLEVQGVYRACRRPVKQQVLLFSATLQTVTPEVLESVLELSHERGLTLIDLNEAEKDLALDHYFCMCPKVSKIHLLHHLLTSHPLFREPHRGIIFAKTIEECETLRFVMSEMGVSITALHSLKDKKHRRGALLNFSAERFRVLIATDLAARGLDLPMVDWVINTSAPKYYDEYCHRVGRCARAGREGTALTIVCPTLIGRDSDKDIETNRIKNIEHNMRKELVKFDVSFFKTQKHVHKIAAVLAEAKLKLEDANFRDKLQKCSERRRKTRAV